MKRTYVLILTSLGILFLLLAGCGGQKPRDTDLPSEAVDGEEAALPGEKPDGEEAALPSETEGGKETDSISETIDWKEMEVSRRMELSYANQFSVDYYEGGYACITIAESGRFLVVPEKKPVPKGLEADITVLKQPLDHIYLVATSAMDLFRELDAVDTIRLSGTDASGWYIDEAREALEQGNMIYAGKYNTPDYELILAENCDLAIESTMISHSPEVKEQLEGFGIPVLIERSSYESHPLGRVEWLKLYGVLLGKEELAEECFREQEKGLAEIFAGKNTEKTVAFFYINSNGIVNVRKSQDYVAKMIELAGGRYIFPNLGDENALSTMNMQMETFYAEAKDADFLIYNSAIDGELETMDDLLAKSGLLADFKAVKEGAVFCTPKNLFQESTGIGRLIEDIHRMLNEGEEEEMHYLYRLR